MESYCETPNRAGAYERFDFGRLRPNDPLYKGIDSWFEASWLPDRRTVSFHQGCILVDGQVNKALNTPAGLGPRHLDPINLGPGANSENQSRIMRGEVASRPCL